jgi:hypothetical protein
MQIVHRNCEDDVGAVFVIGLVEKSCTLRVTIIEGWVW